MRRVLTFSITIVAVVLSWTWAQGEEVPKKLELEVKKGQTVEFTVNRTSKLTGKGDRGVFEWGTTSEITYRLEVIDEKSNGEVVLAVTYSSVKVKNDGRNGPWIFDSSEKAASSSGDVADLIRNVISQKISVVLSRGHVQKISGFPELERGGDSRTRGRRWRALRVVGERRLKADLGHFLTSAVQGHSLEKGKTYTTVSKDKSGAADGDGDQRRRRRGRWRHPDSRLVYTFESQEKDGDSDTAKLLLKQAPRGDSGDSGSSTTTTESKGEASVSLRDGLLLEFDFASSLEWKRGDRKGTWNTTVKITRGKSETKKSRKGTDV